MKYLMYCLRFPVGVHLGEKSLDESRCSFCADTLFSALYMEALKHGADMAAWLLGKACSGEILFSDAFPYMGDTYYLPKPLRRVEAHEAKGDSVIKKAFKSLAYIPMKQMESYMKGDFDAIAEKRKLGNLGKGYVKTSGAIHGMEETRPYHVGAYYFNDGCGLYFIVKIADEQDVNQIYDLLDSLSFSGIGGKRTAGLGRFELDRLQTLDSFDFERKGNTYMSLSISLPKENEMEKALYHAWYQVQKRGGFVASFEYASENRKKKDLFMLSAGSCFETVFQGDVYDVSDGGNHPVYRYAKPIFLPL